MKSFFAFAGKEFLELFRTFKLLILVVVYVIFGMLGPITAKHLPEIIKMAGMDPGALGLGNPTAVDSFAQFFKNVGQMGLLVLVIVYCGIIASELSKGTLINMLTKGLKRQTVILSKIASAVLTWTGVYFLCVGISYGLTAYYFDMDGLHHVLAAHMALWLFGVFLLSLVILGGVLFKSVYGSLLLTGGLVVGLTLLHMIPPLEKYNPISLAADNMALLTSAKELSNFTPTFAICGCAIGISLLASILVFNKKQL